MSLEQQLSDAIAAQNALTQAVAAKKGEIDAAVISQKQAYDNWMANAAFGGAVVRTSKNQVGTVTAGLLDGFSISGAVPQVFSVVKTVTSGIPWANRDATDKEWLTAMGLEGIQHLQPEFNILKCTWNNAQPAGSNWMFFQMMFTSSVQTAACYAKLVSGQCGGGYFQGAKNQVGLCGYNSGHTPLSYTHPHPFVSTASGEIHFALLGSVLGKIPLDSPGNWGFFNSLAAQATTDVI